MKKKIFFSIVLRVMRFRQNCMYIQRGGHSLPVNRPKRTCTKTLLQNMDFQQTVALLKRLQDVQKIKHAKCFLHDAIQLSKLSQQNISVTKYPITIFFSHKAGMVHSSAVGVALPRVITKFLSQKLTFARFSTIPQNS